MSEEGVIIINGTNSGAMSRSRSASNDSRAGTVVSDGEVPKKKRFQNGWSKEQERLMAEWSDIAICYRWLHDKSDKTFHIKTLMISLPVIFLSTISGFSNIGIQAILDSEAIKKYASFAIAAISLLAGLLTTVGDRLRYAQLEESHRVAAIAWGKFQRLIAVELALNPNDRMDSLDFLKICRADLDRLIEQSPSIPKESISLFEKKFGHIKDLKKPDICGALEHTHTFQSSEERLKHMAVEASLMLRRKKQMLAELVSPQVEKKISEQVERRLAEVIEDRKKRLEMEIDLKREEEHKLEEDREKALEERKKKILEEIELEKKKLYQEPVMKAQVLSQAIMKGNASQFESRLNYRRASVNRESSRKSIGLNSPTQIYSFDNTDNKSIIPGDSKKIEKIVIVDRN
jgi:hypothetical protein